MTDLVNSGRSLPNALSSNSTVDGCLAAAKAKGFAVAGLSYYGECWAGAAISSASTTLPASKCTMLCKGNSAQECGGSAALDIYYSTSVSSSAVSGKDSSFRRLRRQKLTPPLAFAGRSLEEPYDSQPRCLGRLELHRLFVPAFWLSRRLRGN
jgi:hypothetical protein